MGRIGTITVTIRTGSVENAGTDGWVYLGICGREFRLNKDSVYEYVEDNDFERGSSATYVFGGSPVPNDSITDRRLNDPRMPQLDSDDLSRFPVYIRFEPAGSGPDWNLASVDVQVGPSSGLPRFGIEWPKGPLWPDGGLWLGQKAGKVCYLKQIGE